MPFAVLNAARPAPWLLVPVLTASLLLAACGDSKDGRKSSGQTVARVNKEELTVHQVNFLLAQQRGIRPEQVDAASRQVLERLIDQELALQKAAEQKLDRDARVVAQLEAARREIIARAYFERVGEGAPKPSSDEVKKYYDQNPALFGQRKVYQLQEINIEATPDKVEQLRGVLKGAKSVNDFVQHLRDNSYKFAGNQVVRGAEQVPMNLLATLSKMSDGQTLFNATPNGASVLVLVSSRAQPVEERSARPAIEQYLTNERKRRLIADDLKALRQSAQIQYMGKFADAAKGGAGATAGTPAPTAADVAASAVGSTASPQAGASPAPAADAPPAGSLDTKTITKGLGLK